MATLEICKDSNQIEYKVDKKDGGGELERVKKKKWGSSECEAQGRKNKEKELCAIIMKEQRQEMVIMVGR